jgi:hypothetical protein
MQHWNTIFTNEITSSAASWPPAYDPTATTIKELVNEFLAAKETLIVSGELAQRTWDDYNPWSLLLTVSSQPD